MNKNITAAIIMLTFPLWIIPAFIYTLALLIKMIFEGIRDGI